MTSKNFGSVKIPEKILPILDEAEVIVAGGGTAGIIAAIAAARSGVKTILIEKEGFLGGALTGTYCTQPGLFGDSNEHQIIKGIGWELIERMEKKGAAIVNRKNWKVQIYPEAIKDIAVEMVIESGVILYLYSWISDVVMDNNRIDSIIIQNKSGRQVIKGKVFIDTTGDADLAYLAGVPTEKLDADNLWQTSVDLKVCNIDPVKVIEWSNENEDEIMTDEIPELMDEYNGIYPMFEFIIYADDTELLPGKPGIKHKGPIPTVKLMIHHTLSRVQGSVELDGTDVKQLTCGKIEARRRALEHLKNLKETIPGFEDAIIIGESYLGVRESRRIIGDYIIKIDDLHNNARFDDVVALNCRPLDRHLKGEIFEISFLEGNHDIPLKALIPQKITNLLVAGRCISSDHDANASLRGAATCMATGHAVGAASALAAKQNGLIRNIDIKTLQSILINQNAVLKINNKS